MAPYVSSSDTSDEVPTARPAPAGPLDAFLRPRKPPSDSELRAASCSKPAVERVLRRRDRNSSVHTVLHQRQLSGGAQRSALWAGERPQAALQDLAVSHQQQRTCFERPDAPDVDFLVLDQSSGGIASLHGYGGRVGITTWAALGSLALEHSRSWRRRLDLNLDGSQSDVQVPVAHTRSGNTPRVPLPRPLTAVEGRLAAVAWDPLRAGRLAGASPQTPTIRMWDAEQGFSAPCAQLLCRRSWVAGVSGEAAVAGLSGLTFTRGGPYSLAAEDGTRGWLWDARRTPVAVSVLRAPSRITTPLEVTPDGLLVFAMGTNNQLLTWDVRKAGAPAGPVGAVSFGSVGARPTCSALLPRLDLHPLLLSAVTQLGLEVGYPRQTVSQVCQVLVDPQGGCGGRLVLHTYGGATAVLELAAGRVTHLCPEPWHWLREEMHDSVPLRGAPSRRAAALSADGGTVWAPYAEAIDFPGDASKRQIFQPAVAAIDTGPRSKYLIGRTPPRHLLAALSALAGSSSATAEGKRQQSDVLRLRAYAPNTVVSTSGAWPACVAVHHGSGDLLVGAGNALLVLSNLHG